MWLFRCSDFFGGVAARSECGAGHCNWEVRSAEHGKSKARQVHGTASAELSRLRREFLLSWQKEPKPLSPTQSGAVKPHRCPALLATRGTAPKLATLRQGRLFGHA